MLILNLTLQEKKEYPKVRYKKIPSKYAPYETILPKQFQTQDVQYVDKREDVKDTFAPQVKKDFKDEKDFFPAKTFSGATEWLDENSRNGDFFLHVESFDVHEPFHVPEPYASMYTDGSSDNFNIWPPYQIYDDLEKFMEQTTPEELAFLESQYMGKTTMVLLNPVHQIRIHNDVPDFGVVSQLNVYIKDSASKDSFKTTSTNLSGRQFPI